jgi:hypothetical protein
VRDPGAARGFGRTSHRRRGRSDATPAT